MGGGAGGGFGPNGGIFARMRARHQVLHALEDRDAGRSSNEETA
jgi:hypothetical protein